MAVFTPVSREEVEAHLKRYDLGRVLEFEPIEEGVENTNYRLLAEAGPHVLTLFERRTDSAALPFCLGLTERLIQRGYPAPTPRRTREGELTSMLNDRPTAIVEWLPGRWLRRPTPADAEAAGRALAEWRRAAEGYAAVRANPFGPAGWRTLLDRCFAAPPGSQGATLDRLARTLDRLDQDWPTDLPIGPIHADYFPDNVLFEDGRVTGVIDVYFACVDASAYDLAVALGAWGFDGDGSPAPGRLEAFRRGYEAVVPLSRPESAALPLLCAGAALRFTLSRLHDRLFHDPTWLVTPKDPDAYLRRLDWFFAEVA